MKLPPIARTGETRAYFSEARIDKVKLGDETQERLIIEVKTEPTDASSQVHTLRKEFNLTGRGASAFSEVMESWCGRVPTAEELADFDSETWLLGKPVTITVGHRKMGKNLVAVIEKFGPAAAAAEASN